MHLECHRDEHLKSFALQGRTFVLLLSLASIFPLFIGTREFVQWDDPQNFEDTHGWKGLRIENVKWAFVAQRCSSLSPLELLVDPFAATHPLRLMLRNPFSAAVFEPVAWLFKGLQFVAFNSSLNPKAFVVTSAACHSLVRALRRSEPPQLLAQLDNRPAPSEKVWIVHNPFLHCRPHSSSTTQSSGFMRRRQRRFWAPLRPQASVRPAGSSQQPHPRSSLECTRLGWKLSRGAKREPLPHWLARAMVPSPLFYSLLRIPKLTSLARRSARCSCQPYALAGTFASAALLLHVLARTHRCGGSDGGGGSSSAGAAALGAASVLLFAAAVASKAAAVPAVLLHFAIEAVFLSPAKATGRVSAQRWVRKAWVLRRLAPETRSCSSVKSWRSLSAADFSSSACLQTRVSSLLRSSRLLCLRLTLCLRSPESRGPFTATPHTSRCGGSDLVAASSGMIC